MKTTSRIALQFTLWIALISGLLLIFLNGIFLVGWLRSETQDLAQYMVLKDFQPRNPITDTLQRWEKIVAVNPANFNPKDYKTFWNINRVRFLDDRRWIIGQNDRFFMILDVSQNVNRQVGLLYMSGILWLIVVFSSFFFGRFFVYRSLRDLRSLAQKLHQRDMTHQNTTLIAPHLPQDDEINAIAQAIESLEKRVFSHYNNLRLFVGHVSHELKTPLMVMRSDIDVADRTKDYDEGLKNLRNSIHNMQNIIETLLMLTRLQSQDTIQKNDVNLYEIMRNTCEGLEKKYTTQHIKYNIEHANILPNTLKANEHLIKILFANIIDNARKYSPEGSTIHLICEKNNIQIINTGTLSNEALDNMRDPFWQADKNRTDGIGIGLSLVQQIARIHNRQIAYSSAQNTITCTIHFT